MAPLDDKSFSTRLSELKTPQCAALPAVFEEATTGIVSQHLDLLQILGRVADDGRRSFSGRLGYFYLTQHDYIERVGPVYSDTEVNPL